jgi:hypothetical protein
MPRTCRACLDILLPARFIVCMCGILSLESHASSAGHAPALLLFLVSFSAWRHSILITFPAGNVSRLHYRRKKVSYPVPYAGNRRCVRRSRFFHSLRQNYKLELYVGKMGFTLSWPDRTSRPDEA